MSGNRISTTENLISDVAVRWKQQYFRDEWTDSGKQKIYNALKALKGKGTEEQIAEIIGNSGWTLLVCNECGKHVKALRNCGEPEDYESRTADLCLDCLRNAVDEFGSCRPKPSEVEILETKNFSYEIGESGTAGSKCTSILK